MKAKFINEKFEEKSDPIEDLGIGQCAENVQKLRQELQNMWEENYEAVMEGDTANEAWIKIDVIERVQETIEKLFD